LEQTVKLLLACEHHPITPARFMADAFEAMPDVDLRHIGTNRGDNTGFSNISHDGIEWHSQGEYQHFWSDWRPDLVLYLDTIYAYYHHSGYRTVPHYWYHIEGVMDNLMGDISRYFHAASYGPNWNKIPEKMTWLPPAYDPAIHTPSPIPWGEREYDVCLISRPHRKRLHTLDRLRAAGLSVHHDYGLTVADYVAAYHNARISLIEHEWGIVPMRTFETAATGNLLLSQWFADYDKLDIKGVAAYPDDIEQIGIVARELLERPEECKALVAQSMEWVKPHTYAARARTIIDWYKGK